MKNFAGLSEMIQNYDNGRIRIGVMVWGRMRNNGSICWKDSEGLH